MVFALEHANAQILALIRLNVRRLFYRIDRNFAFARKLRGEKIYIENNRSNGEMFFSCHDDTTKLEAMHSDCFWLLKRRQMII